MTSIMQVRDICETSHAKSLVSHPLVSVIVQTYNHERFLREAVLSVVNQIAPFSIEVLIVEDHSTDATLQVAFALQREHPTMIRVVHGPVNIGMIPNTLRAIEHCRGDYIAVCEGDDYWTDPHKLERQILQMKRHPEVGVCFTRGTILSPNGSMRLDWDYGGTSRVVPISEILNRGGMLAPTASMIWCAPRLHGLPGWFKNAPVGDLFMFLAGAAPHGALYLPVDMVTYRLGFDGSWTTRLAAEWGKRKVDHARRMIEAYDQAAVSFGIQRQMFWLFASSTRYILFRHELAAGNYGEALRHLLRVHPRYLLQRAKVRIFNHE